MVVATGRTVNGLGIETQDEDDENSAGAIIADLISQGADLHATAPDTGETPLHLAARYFLCQHCEIYHWCSYNTLMKFLVADSLEQMQLKNYWIWVQMPMPKT